MIISKSVLIIRFGLAIAKSNQAESLTLSPYSGPWWVVVNLDYRVGSGPFFGDLRCETSETESSDMRLTRGTGTGA